MLTQQAPLLLPEFDYQLETIASTQDKINLCARSLKAIGCDLIAQVGNPFAWAGAQRHVIEMRPNTGAQYWHLVKDLKKCPT